jgi:hypothetical protein
VTAPNGRLVTLAANGSPTGGSGAPELAWQIDGLELLDPFLVSLVSAGDHWMFVSTDGGLTAGRVDATRCLFPYETDDRLHHAAGLTGPITVIRSESGAVWQPFDPRGLASGRRRTLRKSAMGHWLEFEEEAPELGLTFGYRWTTGRRFGLIRRATLSGSGRVELVDGLLNLMPAEVNPLAQQGLSALVDAYKRSERIGSDLGVYALDAHLSDRASPAEALRANVVWRRGLPGAQLCLSARAVRDLRDGRPTPDRDLELGARGAYLVRAQVDLSSGPTRWDLLGDVHLDHLALSKLIARLRDPRGLAEELEQDLASGAEALRRNIASADGLQHTADRAATVHHFANVVFNNMRGGVFADDHRLHTDDLADFVSERNRAVGAAQATWLAGLPATLEHPELVARAEATGDNQLVRLCLEYLPLTFSRRHGDPSRPWNAFQIRLNHPDGRPVYTFEGNWRDIFQNWEALAQSFPGFLLPMIAKFVNASTADGFNPYRINRAGIDWEEPNPEDPWSNIGYWGDHQIVYLFRLLEWAEVHQPGALRSWLARDLFSTADVPYRLRPYEDLVRDAKDTIAFDRDAGHRAERAVARIGGDGRLVLDADGRVAHVNLLEKLLVTVLAKLSNLVVDGGIWMNTQRPEWNDANNALVGQGLSVVTLAHLRRALHFLAPLVRELGPTPVSGAVVTWLGRVEQALASEALDFEDAGARRRLLDRLGTAFGDYRAAAYAGELGARTPVDGARVAGLCAVALPWVDRSLGRNRRADGLYHSYNLLTLGSGEATVSHLYEMLEGQVAVLGSGMLTAGESVHLVEAMFASRLYRADQHSFLLYPYRERPRFMDRNRVDEALVQATPLLRAVIDAGEQRIGARDADGMFRFHPSFANAEALASALDALAQEPGWTQPVREGRAAVLAAYEDVFDHHAFTGRSGTMYKYEGLGSIYWHMVSKLLLAMQEAWWTAHDAGASEAPALAALYYRVRRGLSFNKDVAEYGAVPSDPYSHTPLHLGAQQPGMTGQVKEEILTRLGELGVRVRDGRLAFEPRLLRRRELWPAESTWAVPTPDGEREIAVPANGLAFTLAGVPVVLSVGGPAAITVEYADGRREVHPGSTLGSEASEAVWSRRGSLTAVRVSVPALTLD